MNKKSICIIFIGVAVLLTGIILTLVNKDSTSNGENSETSKTATISDNVVKSVDYDSDEEEYEYNIDTYINLESDNVSIEGSGASNSDGVITINKAGNYSISGTLNNGKIIVDTDKNSVVKILLNGVNITSNDSSPIFVKGAKKCILTLKEGTESTLEDASSYTYENSDEDEIKVYIGKENKFDSNVTIIRKKYHINGEEGTIAVIGPKRMDYQRIVGLLEYIDDEIDNRKDK